jgi:hypothetical protein
MQNGPKSISAKIPWANLQRRRCTFPDKSVQTSFGKLRHGLNLPDKKAFLIGELIILGSIFEKFGQKVQ